MNALSFFFLEVFLLLLDYGVGEDDYPVTFL